MQNYKNLRLNQSCVVEFLTELVKFKNYNIDCLEENTLQLVYINEETKKNSIVNIYFKKNKTVSFLTQGQDLTTADSIVQAIIDNAKNKFITRNNMILAK